MKSTKHKAEVLFGDFFNRARYGNLACKAVRKTLHYSQATMAQKIHYGKQTLSDFENDVSMNADCVYEVYKAFHKINYDIFTSLDDKDYILYCLRVVSNYGSVLHDAEVDDEDLVKKFIGIFSELYSAT